MLGLDLAKPCGNVVQGVNEEEIRENVESMKKERRRD